MAGFFDWLSGLAGGGGAADAAAATAAAAAPPVPAGSGMFDGPPVFGTGNQVQGVQGGNFSLGQPPPAAGGNALGDALKNLQGSDLTKQPEKPQFLAGTAPPVGRGDPNALGPLVAMLQQRQANLLQAQQQGVAPPQYRTVGLLGF